VNQPRLPAAVTAALAALAAAPDARAVTENINASRIATGTQQVISWAAVDAAPKLPCGACSYADGSTAKTITFPDSDPSQSTPAQPAPNAAAQPVGR
jgi:hypothetical protein